jgi:hypothetical protein
VAIIDEVPAKRTEEPQPAITEPEAADAPPAQTSPAAPAAATNLLPYPLFRQVPVPYPVSGAKGQHYKTFYSCNLRMFKIS